MGYYTWTNCSCKPDNVNEYNSINMMMINLIQSLELNCYYTFCFHCSDMATLFWNEINMWSHIIICTGLIIWEMTSQFEFINLSLQLSAVACFPQGTLLDLGHMNVWTLVIRLAHGKSLTYILWFIMLLIL